MMKKKQRSHGLYEYTTRGMTRHCVSPAVVPSVPDTLWRGACAGVRLGGDCVWPSVYFQLGCLSEGYSRYASGSKDNCGV